MKAASRMGMEAARSLPKAYPRRSDLLKAALDYAKQGLPLFPCTPGGKTPLTPRGFKDATTDRSRIIAWWNRWPNANIGIPTGERSGILALDVDNPASLGELEAKHGELPATRTHATGNGGMHYLLRYPAGERIRNSAGKLGEGLDVRAEAGYIVVPPSRTTRPYEVLAELPLADPPEGLLESAREPHRGRRGKPPQAGAEISAALNGPKILEGERNDKLTRIAGRLNDGSRTLEVMTSDLLEINAVRCTPPLPDTEVERIAASIFKRPPCKLTTTAPPEVLEELGDIEAEILSMPYPGMGGKSKRDTVIALIRLCRQHGTLTPVGVRVSVSVRALAVEAGVSKKSLTRKGGILARLKAEGVIRSDNAGRRAAEAGAFILLRAPRAKGTHSPSIAECLKNPENTCGYPLRAPRLRWGYPGIKRLGKTCGAVLDVLEAAGGEMELAELAAALHHKRPRDLRRRILPPLEHPGMVECFGDTVRLVPGYLDALERRREATGEVAAETRDRERNKRRSLERRERLAGRDTRIPPTRAEIAAVEELRVIAQSHGARRGLRAQRAAVRDVRLLEPIPNLVGKIGRRVRTPHGAGELWDHKGEEARVVLDANPERWIPVDVSSVELLGEAV